MGQKKKIKTLKKIIPTKLLYIVLSTKNSAKPTELLFEMGLSQ